MFLRSCLGIIAYIVVMIKAILFDLDGTLVQTEVLKASSYAKAINLLTNAIVKEERVMAVFENYVGLSRLEVVAGMYKEFSAELQVAIKSTNSDIIQKRIIQKRLSIYHSMLADEVLLSKHFCPYNLKLLHTAHRKGLKVVLATMSHRAQVDQVLELLNISDKLEFVLTRDDVQHGKPHPEIYLKAKELLHLHAKECLVIEDSVNGIKAGLDSGMHVLAVTNQVTKESVHASNLLEPAFIVDELEQLEHYADSIFEAEKSR